MDQERLMVKARLAGHDPQLAVKAAILRRLARRAEKCGNEARHFDLSMRALDLIEYIERY